MALLTPSILCPRLFKDTAAPGPQRYDDRHTKCPGLAEPGAMLHSDWLVPVGHNHGPRIAAVITGVDLSFTTSSVKPVDALGVTVTAVELGSNKSYQVWCRPTFESRDTWASSIYSAITGIALQGVWYHATRVVSLELHIIVLRTG